MDKRGRVLIVFVIMALGFGLVAARLVDLQIIKGDELAARAERQQQRVVKLKPKRGTIYDRMGRELAVSLDVDSVFGVPSQVSNPRRLARRLAQILNKNPHSLERKLSSDRHFVWLSRKVAPVVTRKIKSLGTREVGLLVESRRFYPQKNLAGTAIGFTGIDNEGLEGVELSYDTLLRGTSGWVLAEKDAVGRTVFPGGPAFQYRLSKQGKDIVLTIDSVIQHIVEKELDRALERSQARSGTCVVMDPRTGEVLALTVRSGVNGRPAFNPNTPLRSQPGEWRNRAITDSFEPGSIFKPILAAAALEEKLVSPQEQFDCSEGRILVGGRVIRDASPHGTLTFIDVISDSSNVGTIQVGLRLGKERFHEYIRDFGFGSKTGVDLPGEIDGQVKDYPLWSEMSLGAISIGQAIGVTSLQMVQAFSALANGGTLMKPVIVSEVIDRNKGRGKKFKPRPVRRVISKDTSKKLNTILQHVILTGTGMKAKPVGYTAAGKTGTAQKIDPKTAAYSPRDYMSSFIGYAPAENPRLVILVTLDSPRGAVLGGIVAAPVFKAVAEKSLAYLQVPPDDVGGTMLLVAK